MIDTDTNLEEFGKGFDTKFKHAYPEDSNTSRCGIKSRTPVNSGPTEIPEDACPICLALHNNQ